MIVIRLMVIVLIGFMGTGCQTVPVHHHENHAQLMSAIKSMTQGLTNQPLTDDQLKQLAMKVSKDPKAQSAINSINKALSPQHTVKYCPVDGQRFSGDMEECPIHHVKLEWVD